MSGRNNTIVALFACLALRAQAVNFTSEVLPILEASCFPCHRGDYTDASGRMRKPKGGLRLDGKAWISKGGKEGSVLAPGNALHSPMFTRTVLPDDHEERMPATGDPLRKEQAEVLRRWIDGGADFGAWVGVAGPNAGPPTDTEKPAQARDGDAATVNVRTLDLARVAEGLAPLSATTLAKAAGERAQITPLWHGSALLRVEFAGHADTTLDAQVAALAPLQDHIAILVLARAKITDAACVTIARMRRLVRLDLRDTRISDAGLAHLKELPELRSLNLFAADVSDASLRVLGAMPKLAEVRLWQTKVTAPALAQLRQGRPLLDATLDPALPAPAVPGEGQRGRRRGK